MRTLFRVLIVGALFGSVAVGAASASQTTPVLTPTFTISITGVPSTIARGDVVTAHVAITNLTAADATAKGTWRLVPPKATASSGLGGAFSVIVPANTTVTRDVKFTVQKRAPIGTYTLTASVTGAAAPAVVTFNVT